MGLLGPEVRIPFFGVLIIVSILLSRKDCPHLTFHLILVIKSAFFFLTIYSLFLYLFSGYSIINLHSFESQVRTFLEMLAVSGF